MERQTTLRLTKFEARIFTILLESAKHDLAEDHSGSIDEQKIIFDKLNDLQKSLESASIDGREGSRFYGLSFTRSLKRYAGIKVPMR